MLSRCCAVLVMALAVTATAEDPKVFLVAPTEPLTAAEQQKTFHLPPGYTIELVASEPAIRKPMQLQFDAAGKLWVTQSIEYPFPVKDARPPMDTIRFLTDTDGNGIPDKTHIFAEGLNIPIGLAPVHDGVIGYSIPNIDLFRDANNDGQADERRPMYGEIGSRDTHGMASSFTWWLDGWVYGTHGFANDSTVKGGDGHTIKMNSGNTYRFRPDGSRIEQWTWGQVNPFGLTFDELGNMYSADCHSRPLYMLLRGAYYPSFGKPDDGLGFGPEMITHSHGSTGICGVAWYGATQFPEEHRKTMFICNPVTGRINQDRFDTRGSSYTAVELPDFVTCDDPWFRPVDIKLAPDGSLYVADFYNRIIGHYEVPISHPQRDRERGRIWRISYQGSEKKPLPDLTQADLTALLAALRDQNIVVRTLATHQLVHRIGEPAVAPLREAISNPASEVESAWKRAHGLWVLSRLNQLDDALVATLAKDPSQLVRTHLARCLSERPEWSAEVVKAVETLAVDPDAFVRRAAADALGRHPNLNQVPLLLSMWEQADPQDSHLVHVVRMALRDLIKTEGAKNLPEQATSTPDRVRRLADVCLGVRTTDSARFLVERVGGDLTVDPHQQAQLLHSMVRYAAETDLPKALEAALARKRLDVGGQLAVLRSVQRAVQERGAKLTDEIAAWQKDLAERMLRSRNRNEVRQGLEVAQEFQVRALADRVKEVAQNSPGQLKVRACECLAVLDGNQAVPILNGMLRDGGLELPARQRTADLLAGLNTSESRAALLEGLIVAPAPVQLSIARGLAGTTEGGEGLLKVLAEGKATPGLLTDQVVAEKLKGTKVPDVANRITELTKDVPSDDARLQEVATQRKDSFLKSNGDATRGLAVFTKNCAGCHRLENKGTKVGPDLDGVGARGVDRILEDVLTPNRNVDQAFRATVLELKDGTTVNGLVQREEGQILIVINDQAKEVRVPMEEVAERRQLRLSPMPANLAEQLPVAEFHDLLAYLLSQKTAPVKASE